MTGPFDNWIASRAVDFSDWPFGGEAFWPYAVKWGVIAASIVAIWMVAAFVRMFMRFIGHRAIRPPDEFDGSSWDLGASVSRFLVLIALSPVPLSLAGIDWQGFTEKRGPGLFAALAILFAAVLVANWVSRALRNFGRKTQRRTGRDDTLLTFIASFLKYAIFAIALLLALTQLGFPTASLAALLGASALAIGLALQDTLKAVAAGIMLAIFRPFRIGDFVSVAGLDGIVSDITPFTTSLRQIDNKIVSVTNDKVWNEPLVNHTHEGERNLDIRVSCSYEDDIDAALGLVRQMADEEPLVQHKDRIWVGVYDLGDSGVVLRLRAWVMTHDFVQARANLLRAIKLAFDRAGLTMPYPHQTQVPYRHELKGTGSKNDGA
jgi:small conductance mechanosensitive channel